MGWAQNSGKLKGVWITFSHNGFGTSAIPKMQKSREDHGIDRRH